MLSELRPGAISSLLAELARAPVAATGWTAPPAPGETIGRFQIEREIGRGGFGVVYAARDNELGRRVAFKAVRTGPLGDIVKERALAEAEAAARLAHPNIVTLHDVGCIDRGAYLILELLEGETLRERLQRGRLEWREGLRIGVDVARAMAHAHAAEVVHRDLTPSNVFLCRDGQVKVLDFGLAHVFEPGRGGGGTPGYIPPEQLAGGSVDARGDVYALGVILHQMWTGKLLFEPGTETGIAKGTAAPPLPGAPRRFKRLVARMLAREPSERPADGAAVYRELIAIQQQRESRIVRVSVVAALVAVVLGAGLAVRMRTPAGRSAEDAPLDRSTASAKVPSVAVLPFADLSPGKDQDWMCDGIAEEIISALSSISGLRVVARSSSFQFKSRTADVREMARVLGATTLLEGSVRKAGEQIRINARLVGQDGNELWSETFDRPLEDTFDTQEEIARTIVRAMQIRLSSAEESRLGRTGTRNPRAYELYLRGRKLARAYVETEWESARRMFKDAIELDPRFAQAHAGLADTTLTFLHWQLVPRARQQAMRTEALAASEEALRLGPQLAEAHVAHGNVMFYLTRPAEAEASFKRATALSPGLADVWYFYGRFLFAIGRYDEAARAFEETIRRDPDDYHAYSLLTMTYRNLDDPARRRAAAQRGLAAVERLLRITPDDVRAVYSGGMFEISLDHRERGFQYLDRAVSLQPRDFATLYNTACGYAIAGEKEKALDLLDRAVDTGRGFRAWMERDSDLDSLRASPRFQQLLARLPPETERE